MRPIPLRVVPGKSGRGRARPTTTQTELHLFD